MNGPTPLDEHLPPAGAATPAAPAGTAPPHEPGSGAPRGAAARSIRVLVVGAPGAPVEALLALLDRILSVETVGAPTDVAVVDLPEDGGPGPCAATACARTADVRATPRPRPPEAVGRVLERPARVPRPRPAGRGDAPGRSAECSPREREVLAVVAEGASNPEIAARLSISEATVRSHVQSLRGKLGARSRAELVVRAFEMGLGPSACAH